MGELTFSHFLVKMPKVWPTIDKSPPRIYNTLNKWRDIMKKFLWFIVVAIAVVSFGLTIYYFSADNEVIYVRSSYIVVEEGDFITTNSLIEIKHKGKDTTLSFSSQNEDVLSFRSEGNNFEAKKGGQGQIIVTTSNKRYSTLVIDVLVCDGSAEYPYVITTEAQLRKIGDTSIEGNKYTSDKNYRLGDNISLEVVEEGNWSPIQNFTGTFDGNFYTISNVNITDSTLKAENYENKFVGFFDKIAYNATVKNLILSNFNINVSEAISVGAVAGLNQGTVRTCLTFGSIEVANKVQYLGGVVGNMYVDSTATDPISPIIDRCGFEGAITLPQTNQESSANLGGIVGKMEESQLSESYFRTTQDKVLKNYSNQFGGIVGTYSTTNKLYDNYAFFGGLDENATNPATIAGVIATNSETNTTRLQKSALGNYFGGNENISNAVLTGETLNSTVNKYLTNEQFSSQNNFVTYVTSAEDTRYWNFYSVWEYSGSYIYPVLNIFSSVGSSYLDNPEIVTDSTVKTAQELYDALAGNGKYTTVTGLDIQGEFDAETGKYYIDMDPEVVGWTWGDDAHPIPAGFDKTIASSTGCIIKNLVITNTDTSATKSVGLVANLGKNAIVSALTFDKVSITGNPAQYVGVICGVDEGAMISSVAIQDLSVNLSEGYIPVGNWEGVDYSNGWQNTTVKTVVASARAIGAVAGKALSSENYGIQHIDVANADFSNCYFLYAGGIVGYNNAIITKGIRSNNVSSIKLNATYAGGIVGNNFGKVEYCNASNVEFKKAINETNKNTLFKTNIFVGGISGTNNGNIAKVKVQQLNIELPTTSGNYLSLGGVSGANNGAINNAKVLLPVIKTTGKYYVMAGGLVGKNSAIISGNSTNGTIAKSTVTGGSIDLDFSTNGKSAYNNKNVSIIATGSMAGGLVGYDDRTTSAYSIQNCSTTITKVSGFFAGGFAGLSYGKLSKLSAGDTTKVYGGLEINGFHAGGFSAGIADGFVKDSFVLCTVKACTTTGSYSDISSVVGMEVSASAGYAVLISNNAEIIGNYAVVEFGGNGVSFSTTADLQGKYVGGKYTGNIYMQSGAVTTSNIGTKLTKEQITGQGGDFSEFTKNIGCSGNVHDIWDLNAGQYPTLKSNND